MFIKERGKETGAHNNCVCVDFWLRSEGKWKGASVREREPSVVRSVERKLCLELLREVLLRSQRVEGPL